MNIYIFLFHGSFFKSKLHCGFQTTIINSKSTGEERQSFLQTTSLERAKLDLAYTMFTFLSVVCIVLCVVEAWTFSIVLRAFNYFAHLQLSYGTDMNPIMASTTTGGNRV